MSTFISTIDTVEYVTTSKSGNPTYRVFFTDGRVHLTQTDGSIGYILSAGSAPRDLLGRVEVTLDRGRVQRIVPAPESPQASVEETIARLREIADEVAPYDPEAAHSAADAAILALLPADVADAVQRIKDKAGWWACG